jgi:hypothetical protein
MVQFDHFTARRSYGRGDAMTQSLFQDGLGQSLVASSLHPHVRRLEEGERTFVCGGQRHSHLTASQGAMGRHENHRIGMEPGRPISQYAHGPHRGVCVRQAVTAHFRHDDRRMRGDKATDKRHLHTSLCLFRPAISLPQEAQRPSLTRFLPRVKPRRSITRAPQSGHVVDSESWPGTLPPYT